METTHPFPRSDSPLISVSLPTRGRPTLLTQAIHSLHEKSAFPDKIEYLFRADTDDKETIEACTSLVHSLPQATLVVEPRGAGYVNIHHWHGRLCQLARGDWLLIFNDDAIMTTPRWDEIISTLPADYFPCPDVALAFFVSKDRPGCNEFFILRRTGVEILGYFSLSPHADNWLHRVYTQLKACGTLPQIIVEHNSHLMTDQTRQDSVAAYANGALARATLESYEAQLGIKDSVGKLRTYIDTVYGVKE